MHDYQQDIPFWVAAIESGFLKEPLWINWAEKHVISQEPTQLWLVDLYQADSSQDALGILRTEWPNSLNTDYTRILLGFLFLSWQARELSLNEFLKIAGRKADEHNYDYPQCETVYDLLTRHEKALAKGQLSQPYEEEARKMFADHSLLAKTWLHSIASETA